MGFVFAYTARSGEGQFVAGTLRAESRDQALAHLRTRRLFVTSLGERGSARGAFGAIATALPLSRSARTAFFRSFAALIGAGVPIRRALDVVIVNCQDARLREALSAVANDIESGSDLSSAMSKRPREFSRLSVAMIRAGELGGALEDVLERTATLLERHDAVRKRVRAAMTYPLIVAAASLALVLFLVDNTVPAFAAIFAEMHVRLPLVTRIVLAAGRVLHSATAWVAIATVPVATMALLRSRLVPSMQDRLHRVVLAIPAVGLILRRSAVARFSRTLGTLLRSGVPLLGAIEAAGDVVENTSYERGLNDLSDALREGSTVADALDRTALFEGVFLQLVRVGEETGTLDAMLLRVADYYELDVETALTTLGSILEPLLILALGSIIGAIVAAIVIPLYSMIGSIK